MIPIEDGADDYEPDGYSEDAAALTGAAVYYTQGADVTAAGNSSGASAVTTTPPNVPAIEKAVPSITGPAPLFAGEAPDSNPQAAIP